MPFIGQIEGSFATSLTNELASLEFPAWLEEYTNCINDAINLYFSNNSPLEKTALEAITRGKRIRAVLALLWCETQGEDYRLAAPVAVAYELAHAAALVQDDIIDDSSMRRGEKSIFGKYGTAGAILTSNTLLFKVPNLVAECGRQGSDSVTICKLLDLLGECYRSATLGEFMDLELAEKKEVSEKEYEEMIRLKTGALIGASSASGAIIGSGMRDNAVVKAAYGFGESLGMAYQVQDDVLDLMGEEEILGKPIFADVRRGKKSLVLIHLLNHCSDDEKKFVKSLFGKSGPYEDWEIARTRGLLKKYNSPSMTQEFAARCIERAEKYLLSVKESVARERLLELSNYLAMRKY